MVRLRPQQALLSAKNHGLPPPPASILDELPSIPRTEADYLAVIATDAFAQAEQGRVASGYAILLAARDRAGMALVEGESWAVELIGVYEQILERFRGEYAVPG